MQRLLHLISGPFDPETSFLVSLSGTECVAEGQQLDLVLWRLDTSVLRSSELVGQCIGLAIDDGLHGRRVIHGMIREASRDLDRLVAGYRCYQIVLSDWFSILDITRAFMVWKNKNIVEVAQSIFRDRGLASVDYGVNVAQSHRTHTHLTQYDENDYAFLNRHFERCGIHTYYEHSDRAHCLVLRDEQTPWPWGEAIHLAEPEAQPSDSLYFHQWLQPSQVLSQRWCIKGYVDEDPNARIAVYSAPLYPKARETFTVREYLGGFASEAEAQALVDRRLRAVKSRQFQSTVIGNNYLLQPGYCSPVHNEHSRLNVENISYRVIALQHTAHDYSGLPSEIGALYAEETTQSYGVHAKVHPEEQPYAPFWRHDWPAIDGHVPAIVAGTEPDSVNTDELARIKVTYPWDQREDAKTTGSTHWCYVAQPISGPGWGTQFIPRVGTEVAVMFERGDPDKPVVIGQLYNDEQVMPFKPDEAPCNGIMTRLRDGTGHHQLAMNDDTYDPSLYIFSTKNYQVRVEGNAKTYVSETEELVVEGDILYVINKGGADLSAGERLTLQCADSKVVLDDSGVHFHAARIVLRAPGAKGSLIRVGDEHDCAQYDGLEPHQGGHVLSGSAKVDDEGLAVARVGDKIYCQSGDSGKITEGIDSITIGGVPIAALGGAHDHTGVIKSGSTHVLLAEPEPLPRLRINQHCQIKRYQLACSHRSATPLDVLAAHQAHDKPIVYEVLLKESPCDEIMIHFSGRCGHPPYFPNRHPCPELELTYLDRGTQQRQLHHRPFTLPARLQQPPADHSVAHFFKEILLAKGTPMYYTLTPYTCDPGHDYPTVQVHAYPAIRWQAEFHLQYKFSEATLERCHQDPKHIPQGQWHSGGAFAVSHGQHQWQFGTDQSHASHLPKNKHEQWHSVPIDTLFNHLQGWLSSIMPAFGRLKSCVPELDVHWPKLTFSGAVYNQEAEAGYSVDTQGKIALGFDPLFGIGMQADVLNWLLVEFPPLLLIKKRLEAGVGTQQAGVEAKLQVLLIPETSVSGEWAWEKALESNWQAASGESECKFEFKIEAVVGGEIQISVFKGGAEADISLATSISLIGTPTHKAGKPALKLAGHFNGLKVHAVVSVYMGMEKEKTSKKTLMKSSNTTKLSAEHTKEYTQVLMKEQALFKEQVIILEDGVL